MRKMKTRSESKNQKLDPKTKNGKLDPKAKMENPIRKQKQITRFESRKCKKLTHPFLIKTTPFLRNLA